MDKNYDFSGWATKTGVKCANEIREDLLKDKNSEYYKYVHAGG